jgi:alpha-1,3-mannosyltransferase
MKTSLNTKNILGLRIAVLDKYCALLFIKDQISHATPLKLGFANANLANLSQADKSLHNNLQTFLLLNDGSGVGIASRVLYRANFPDNLNGTDFIPFFLDYCDVPLRIYLLGSTPRVSEAAKSIFKERWPQHEIVGAQHGYFDRSDTSKVLTKIKKACPNLIFVAMGNGLQECWVSKLVPDFSVSAWGVGAFLDFLCNEVPRAPKWMRTLGVEWIFRLWREPKRLWKRYLIGNFIFIYYVILQLTGLMRSDF